MAGSKQFSTPQLRGATLALGLLASCAGFGLPSAVLGGFSVWQSIKSGKNPLSDLKMFCSGVIEGFQVLGKEEQDTLSWPAVTLSNKFKNQAPLFVAGKTGQTLDQQWLHDVAGSENLAVLGDQGEGKSTILHYLIYRFLQKHPNGRVWIHDIEGGQGHGKINQWLGLPHVFQEPQELLRLAREVRQGIEDTDMIPTLLVVDEFTNTMGCLSPKAVEETVDHLKQIANRGKKRNIFFVIGSHEITAKDLKLNKAFIQKFTWVILPTVAALESTYANLCLPPESKTQKDKALEDLAVIDRAGGVYPCVVCTKRDVSLRRVPDLSGMPETLQFESEQSPDEWLADLVDRHSIDPSEFNSIRKLTEAINEALDESEEPQVQRKNSDERYLAIKRLYEGGESANHEAPRDTGKSLRHAPAKKVETAPPEVAYYYEVFDHA